MRKLSIVIAEDDPDDGKFIYQSFLKHPAFSKVTWVRNGKELIDTLTSSEEKPDVVLTDINMPLLTGIEALEIIHKDGALNKIFVFTYSSTLNPLYQEKSKELGSLGFLIKPYNLFEFDEIPDHLLKILDA